MKNIDKKNFSSVGYILKSHGNKGEVKIRLHHFLKLKEWIFVEINQKPVPFFIEQKSTDSNDMILKLKSVNTVEDAMQLQNKTILYPKDLLKKSKSVDEDIIGFLISDKNIGNIGLVESIHFKTPQPIIKTTYLSKELLIPGVEPIIKDIDLNKKTIFVDLPQGFIEVFKN